jgi:hypothetical protein
MNIAMEQTEEYVNGQLKAKYGDAFIRGNNGAQPRLAEARARLQDLERACPDLCILFTHTVRARDTCFASSVHQHAEEESDVSTPWICAAPRPSQLPDDGEGHREHYACSDVQLVAILGSRAVTAAALGGLRPAVRTSNVSLRRDNTYGWPQGRV